jgi:thiol-disulfide isomerase/thioredoxin
MKKILTVAILLCITMAGFGQNDTLPSFRKFPTLPPLKLLLTDSSTWFTKENIPSKKATLIMIFSPDCDHCQHETEEIIKNIERFKNIEIVMATPRPFESMKAFYKQYNLSKYKNITVGRDAGYVLPVFYNIKMLPYLAFYDKKGQLIDTFEGSLPIAKVLEKFNQ